MDRLPGYPTFPRDARLATLPDLIEEPAVLVGLRGRSQIPLAVAFAVLALE
jgi:hypothetical protein